MLKITTHNKKVLISFNDLERIDVSNAKEISGKIESCIKAGTDILINLNKVFYIDTEGFKALTILKEKTEIIGGRMRLIQLSAALTDLFNLMGLCDKFEWASAEHLSDPAFAG